MGDPRPHRGPAEERDGDPQHNHRGPPPEGLGTLHGPEELHHIRRSAKMTSALSAKESLLFRFLFNEDLAVSKGDSSIHFVPNEADKRGA